MAYSKAVNKATKKWMKTNREKITFVTEKGFYMFYTLCMGIDKV